MTMIHATYCLAEISTAATQYYETMPIQSNTIFILFINARIKISTSPATIYAINDLDDLDDEPFFGHSSSTYLRIPTHSIK